MPDSASADVRLGYLGDVDGALGSGYDVELALEGILEGERVDDSGEHTGVVGCGSVHAVEFGLCSAPDISAAYDNANLDAHF